MDRVHKQVDKLIQNKHHVKRWHLFVLAIVMLSLGTIVAIPVIQRKTGVFNEQTPILSTFNKNNASASPLNGTAYEYFKAPKGSFGIKSAVYWNHTWIKTKIRNNVDWMLETNTGSGWFDNSEKLNVGLRWNDTFKYFKLWFNVSNLEYGNHRITFYSNIQNLSSMINKSDDEIWIYYPIANETLSLCFNYSDLKSIPGLTFRSGRYNGYWYFRFRRNGFQGNYSFDPTFGETTDVGGTISIENYMEGINVTCPEAGTAEFIAMRLQVTSQPHKYAMALYYASNLSLLAYTQEKDIGVTGGEVWKYFYFTNGSEPTLTNQNYVITAWVEAAAGSGYMVYSTSGLPGIWEESETYDYPNWVDPTVMSNWTAGTMSIYCNYSVAADFPSTLTLSGLSTNSVYNNTISWNASYVDVATISKWINSSGFRYETVEVEIVVNATTNITQVQVYAADLNNSGHMINGSNITLWVSGDNVTWTVCGCDIGNGDGVFLDGGGYLNISAATWDEPSDNPFTYHGNGTVINEDCSIYLRYELNMSYITTFNAGNYSNDQWWYVYGFNDTWMSYVYDDYNATFNYTTMPPRSWQQIQTWNFSYSNTTDWRQIQTWNFSYSNSDRNWTQVQTWNFSYSNSSIDKDWNQTQSWNFSYSNTTDWQQIQTWNFSYSNSDRAWVQVQTWNFSYSNSSIPFAWYQIQTWNFSYSNSSLPLFTITDEYPSNQSFIYDLQPTVFFTLTHPDGNLMNYTVYYGNSSANCTHVLATGTNVGNGTYNANEYFNATQYQRYFYRIQANDSAEWVNETLYFNCSTEPQIIGGNGLAIGIAMAASMLAIGFIFIIARRRRNNEYY